MLGTKVSDLFFDFSTKWSAMAVDALLDKGRGRPFPSAVLESCLLACAASASFLDCFALAVSESGGTEVGRLFAPLPGCFSVVTTLLVSS